MRYFECRGYRLPLGRKTYIMGILNVTPDSFSDGGKYNTPGAALARAKKMVEEGADIIDIGGESTRPGFVEVDEEEELNRVLPVLELLVNELDVPVSIDTRKGIVAEKVLDMGAHIVNDIWGLQGDRSMAKIAAKYNAGVIVMHNKAEKIYDNLLGEVKQFLAKSADIAQKLGISRNSIVIDPGIGFGKTFLHNLEILGRLEELGELGFPVLIGTSRKSFIGKILDLPVDERVEGTAASVAIGIAKGADFVRVHDVKEMARVARVSDSITRGWNEEVEG
ncbi:MAG: dihydropteroate synthase [Clostridiaceae bacterium]|nr:dihydropteroate synthase [Clostridiaceae bacterium]